MTYWTNPSTRVFNSSIATSLGVCWDSVPFNFKDWGNDPSWLLHPIFFQNWLRPHDPKQTNRVHRKIKCKKYQSTTMELVSFKGLICWDTPWKFIIPKMMGLGICSETASIMVILGTHVNFVCVFMISIAVLNLDWASCACVAGAPRSKGGCDYWKTHLFQHVS